MGIAGRLFSKRADALLEHPTDLPLDVKDIPIGKLEGWHAFAPKMRGPGREIILGPFVPEIKMHSSGYLFIVAEDGAEYWYDAGNGAQIAGRPDIPCWYQSGCTLRFYKVPEHWDEVTIQKQLS